MAKEASVIAVFDSPEAAHAAAEALVQAGYPQEKISVLGKDEKAPVDLHQELHEPTILKDMTFAGILGGGLFGFLVGLTLVWIPGVGAVVAAGPLAASLIAGLEGAAVGAASLGLVSGLLALGATEEEVHEYRKRIEEGKYLVIVHSALDRAQAAHDLLKEQGAELVDVLGESLLG